MKTVKYIHIIFIINLLLIVSSCVPKATETKAVCGAGQAFNNTTRSCVNTVEARTKPAGTLSADRLNQESSKTITLVYKDGNNNLANSCKLTNISSNIEAMSPLVSNGAIYLSADLIFQSAQTAANNLPAGADKTQALIYRDNMQNAINAAKATFDYSEMLNQLGVYKLTLDNLFTLLAPYTSTYSTVKYYYDQAQDRLVDYLKLKVFVDNRCSCSGGICTTIVATRMHETGVAGFSYTITDVDGEGSPAIVNLTINPLSAATDFLLPAAESSYVTFTESASNVPGVYSFSLPVARDYLGTTSFNYNFNGAKSAGYGITSKGKVYGCMDLVGSTGPTDTACLYTPNTSGNTYDTATPVKATAIIGDLTYTAKSEGSFANNYSIQYFNLQNNNLAIDPYATSLEQFGLASQSYKESYIRVVGDQIRVFINKGITSSNDIKNLINADAKAKSMVTVTGGSISTFPDPAVLTANSILLSSAVAGSDAFDKISFSASNGTSVSTNTSNVLIKMNHTDHAPLVPTEYNLAFMPSVLAAATTTAQAEGLVSQTITLPYYDVDNTPAPKAVSCAVDFTTLPNMGLEIAPVTTCSCVGIVCSVSVVSDSLNLNFNGTAKFSYTITTIDQFSVATKTSGSQTVSIPVWEVNSSPVLTATDATTIVSGVSTPVAGPIVALTTQENSTASPSSAYICATATVGSGTDESIQTLSLVPTQIAPTSNPSMAITFGAVKIPGATGNTCTAGKYMIAFSTTQNQSGTTNIKLTLTDNGTTHGVADPKTVTQTIPLTVNMVNDPPYFVTTVTGDKVETNEGGMVVAGPFKVDEDQANSPDENTQSILITSVVSDNHSVLTDAVNPNTSSPIRIFYDLNDNGVEDAGEERNLSVALETTPAVDDARAHNFYLKLYPVAGVSGNANITITVNDGLTPVTKTFSLIVHPIAALHGGWTHISAIGIKTDKNGAPAAIADVQCNYNKTTDAKACNTNQNCTGASSPNATVKPDEAGVLYWDSSSKKCYRSLGSDVFSWTEFKTTCPVTRISTLCTAENCIKPTGSEPIPTAVGQFYYNTTDNLCYISTGTLAGNWTTYTPSKVTLNWNAFTVTGTTILGWNIYRREKDHDYDFINGYLKTTAVGMTIDSATTRTFTDLTAVAGKVYYYLVRPVDSSGAKRSISTPEIFSEVRVLAPVENYAFVHRWMANQEVCNSMHMTTTTTNKVDPTHNYRCPYYGPANVLDVGDGKYYYDIGKDMLVDISESGCPYTAAPFCDPTTGCVGIGDPTTLSISADKDDVYYDRNSGACYVNTSAVTGVSWATFNTTVTAAAVAKSNTALNAPLTNISKSKANSVCTSRSSATATASLTGVISTPLLPTKKEYIAYSSAPFGLTDSLITPMEEGFSLNVQSRCNSSNANGLTSAYTDSNIPSSSFIYSLPGTASSGIKSLYTGSSYTEACSSRYGVQDIYGNVAEWVADGMTCNSGASTTVNAGVLAGDPAMTVVSTTGFPTTGTLLVGSEQITYTGKTATTLTGLTRGANGTVAAAHSVSDPVYFKDAFACNAIAGTDLGNYDFGSGITYGFDYLTGPYNDANGNSNTFGLDAFLTNWLFRDELYGAGKFSFPLGMPINLNIATASSAILSTSPALPYILDIGPTAGITSTQLHEDGIIVNGSSIAGSTGHFAQGGSYLSGNLSGRYSSELIPDSTITRPDVGFRCYIPIDKTNYFSDSNGRHPYSY